MDDIGFIMLRHVNSELSNSYWCLSYDCIRKYYPECIIIIIDDNSNYKYISDKFLYKTIVIKSEYPGRAELLPYYYYLSNHLFNTAVIIHDSVFINSYIRFQVDTYKIIWCFEHDWDQIEDEKRILSVFNDEELNVFHENKHLWKGCFGGMSVITYDYLSFINSKYDISKMLDSVLNRYNRMSFERVIACLLQINQKTRPLFGDINKYCKFGLPLDKKYMLEHLPLIKVWTGR